MPDEAMPDEARPDAARPSSPAVDAHLAALPADRRARLAALRETARAAARDAEEVITYRMPGLRLDGRFLVSYDAFKAHDSMFPASQAVLDALGDEVAPHVAGRGTLRFSTSEPLPLELVRRIVEVRVREVRGTA